MLPQVRALCKYSACFSELLIIHTTKYYENQEIKFTFTGFGIRKIKIHLKMTSNFGRCCLTFGYYIFLFDSPLTDCHHTDAVCFFEIKEIVMANLSISEFKLS